MFVCIADVNSSFKPFFIASLFAKVWTFSITQRKKITDNKKIKPYPIGYFHVDIAEVQTEEGRIYLFVGIDRTSKIAYAELHTESTRATAKEFLEHPITSVPYKIHTILTDNGIQFVNRKKDTMAFMTPFDRICIRYGIEHRLTKVNSLDKRTSGTNEPDS